MNEIRCGQNTITDINEYDERFIILIFLPQFYSWFPSFVPSFLNTYTLYPS